MCFISSCRSSLCHSDQIYYFCYVCWIHTHACTLSRISFSSRDDNDDDELFFSSHWWTVNTMVHAPCFYSKWYFFWDFPLILLHVWRLMQKYTAITVFSDFFSNFTIALIAKSVFYLFALYLPFSFWCFYCKMKISFYYLIRRRIITNNMPLRMQQHDNLVQYCARP